MSTKSLAEHEALEREPDQRRAEHLAERLDVVELDVVRGRVAPQHLDRERMARPDDRVAEGIPERGQAMALLHHDQRQLALARQLGEAPARDQRELGAQVRERAQVQAVRQRRDLLHALRERHLQELLLRAEVLVERARARREAGRVLDLGGRGRVEALRREQLERRVEDALPGGDGWARACCSLRS